MISRYEKTLPGLDEDTIKKLTEDCERHQAEEDSSEEFFEGGVRKEE